MSRLRITIKGESADQPHLIQITNAGSGEKMLDVESFDLHAHVTDGVTCLLHRLTMKIDPETQTIGRFDSEAEIAEADIEAYEQPE
jgi:hypothetical protein